MLPEQAAEEDTTESILDSVTAAYESLDEDDPAPDPEPSPDDDPTHDPDDDPDNPKPDEDPDPKPDEDPDPDPKPDEDPDPDPDPEVVSEAPEHWAADDKAMFDAQSPEAKAWLLKRHNEMESHFTKQTQENADLVRDYEPVRAIMSPFKNSMTQMGLSESDVIRRWAAAENSLNTNPVSAIKQLAAVYKVDLSQLNGSQPSGADPYFEGQEQTDNPEVTALRTELDGIKTSMQTDALIRANQQIVDFKTTKDGDGNLKYPFFDELAGDITQLAEAAQNAGQQINLSEIYERAVWANPTTREKLQTSQREAEADANKAKAAEQTRLKKEKAAKAKAASKSVRPSTEVGAAGGGAENKNSTLRQDVEAAYEKAEDKI